ncbi:MAG: glycoside hydrolase family 3 N-terminal domain-containing protein [Sediminibacterium sp.]|nr:glycoside hydrolase family 3 N-terminal domain-containing protein [Sediminibacterium sp.]
MLKRYSLISIWALLWMGFTNYRNSSTQFNDPDFLKIQQKWVDSVFQRLSPDERLGQLFMVAAYSNKDNKHVKEIRELIQMYHIGGLIWMQGGPLREARLANYYQSLTKVPLLYSIDGEWGLNMRLDSTPRYPKQMTLGAIQNNQLIFEMGQQIARECKRLGIHINFAPVADVNNNPNNPVIGMRSFGEDKLKVTAKALAYMKGLQSEQVMANGKHFPGHGDTDVDSHKGLPLIPFTKERLDSLELYPFKELFKEGLSSIMVAHLNIPALDTTKNRASTLSPNVVNGLLKTELGFKGLVFTDALNMKGAAAFNAPGIVDVKAILAGNDVLLFSEDVGKAFAEIKKAIANGEITQEEIDTRCKKILMAKYWCGLNKSQYVSSKNLFSDLNSKESTALNEKLARAAITLIKNDSNLLPLPYSDSTRILEVSVGIEEKNSLHQAIKQHGYVQHAGITHDPSQTVVEDLMNKVQQSEIVIIQLNKTTLRVDNNYGVGNKSIALIDSIARIKPTMLVVVGNPYLLNKLKTPDVFKSIILAYEYMPSLLKAAGDLITGEIGCDGQLPVTCSKFKAGTGIVKQAVIRPAGTKEKNTPQKKNETIIDSIAVSGIKEGAYPGCQVVALHKGEVIYQKAFGHFTYNKDSKAVDNGSVYDLASVTKIAASALALMKLKSEGKLDYKKTLGDYLPELKGTNKETLVLEDVMAHQAGLQAWIPFYLKTLTKKDQYRPGYYAKKPSDQFPTRVARKLYVVKGFEDTIYNRINNSKVEERGKYLYSDLGYYYLQKIIERISGKKLNAYVEEVYAQMGLGLCYNPQIKHSLKIIVPTENDTKWRKQTVHGFVHDPGAALLGGVAGHAGLFGNALDLARLMQMYLHKGTFGSRRYLDSSVVNDFSSCHFCPNNRRGLCFEKPEPDPKKDSPVTELASLRSFGHSGFTGTFAWADPENDLIVVFLSNRVYPNAEDNKLAKLGIRGKIHRVFYEWIKNN